MHSYAGTSYTESIVPVNAGLTITGAARDMRSGRTNGQIAYTRFRAGASADVAGTLTIQQSLDGTTGWVTTSTDITGTVAASATAMVVIESKVILPFCRAVLVNGGSNQASVLFVTQAISD